uniref:GTD-binding domain-containing protein n=1 Tax=Picea sitchensis TaxID=3332 RepID=A9NQ44_PICSI|nr:unknown [Picea sitchensis]
MAGETDIITAVLQLAVSFLLLIRAVISFITSKLERCQSCQCHHRELELEEELDKERSAAATAAQEAMAMIARLQKEKASLKMESRQYRITAEQKHFYDLQAINFLKEIVTKLQRDNLSHQQLSFSFPNAQDEEQRLLAKVCLSA